MLDQPVQFSISWSLMHMGVLEEADGRKYEVMVDFVCS